MSKPKKTKAKKPVVRAESDFEYLMFDAPVVVPTTKKPATTRTAAMTAARVHAVAGQIARVVARQKPEDILDRMLTAEAGAATVQARFPGVFPAEPTDGAYIAQEIMLEYALGQNAPFILGFLAIEDAGIRKFALYILENAARDRGLTTALVVYPSCLTGPGVRTVDDLADSAFSRTLRRAFEHVLGQETSATVKFINLPLRVLEDACTHEAEYSAVWCLFSAWFFLAYATRLATAAADARKAEDDDAAAGQGSSGLTGLIRGFTEYVARGVTAGEAGGVQEGNAAVGRLSDPDDPDLAEDRARGAKAVALNRNTGPAAPNARANPDSLLTRVAEILADTQLQTTWFNEALVRRFFAVLLTLRYVRDRRSIDVRALGFVIAPQGPKRIESSHIPVIFLKAGLTGTVSTTRTS